MVTINAWYSAIPVEISKGGTNASSFATANGIVKYDGTRLVTSSTAQLDASNQMTNTSQPAFLAYSAAIDNVTGDATVYTVTFANEIFDNGADFDGTSTFTAPLTGRYQFSITNSITGLSASHTVFYIYLVTSNRSYAIDLGNPYAQSDTNSLITFGSLLADMDSADTAYVTLDVRNGTKTVEVTTNYRFSGFLVC